MYQPIDTKFVDNIAYSTTYPSSRVKCLTRMPLMPTSSGYHFFSLCKKHIKVQQFQQEQRALRSNWIEVIIQVVSKDENVFEWFSLLNSQL